MRVKHHRFETVARMTLDEQRSHPGILLGSGPGGWTWSGHQRSALILGPTRSGKTTSFIIPNVLSATGAVVSTSTKPDVMRQTARARSAHGTCLLFDPSGTLRPPSGVERIGWSPMTAAHRWDGALDISRAMVAASRSVSARAGGFLDHWTERAGALLAPLLHAAALTRAPMSEVLSWVDHKRPTPALDILEGEHGPHHPATGLLVGIATTDQREQSGIWSTTAGVLGAYRSLGALDSTAGVQLDAASFVEGSHTLFIAAPGRNQSQLAPLVVGLLSEIQDAAYRRSNQNRPVLFALDELANIAPLPDLASVVSEGGGQGLLTLGCLQDLSQARARWGAEADGFLSLFSSTVVLGGVADPRTLKTLSDLAGLVPAERPGRSISRSRRSGLSSSSSVSTALEHRLPPDQIARGVTGHGLLLDAANEIGWVPLTISWRDDPWRLELQRGSIGLDLTR